MTAARVWAPAAKLVELVLDGGRQAMQRADDGWWSSDVPLAPGSDYAYAIDGGEALPDPRSPWQPHGVHGFSRAVDHAQFRWCDGGWQPPPLARAIVYELHVGTFTGPGTFATAIERLDHLVDLGITHVELMPVAEFPGARGWGYDGVDLYAPHQTYGGPDGLKQLVDACHGRGLAVLLDVVYNHLGPSGNYLERFGPYFTDRYRTPWGAGFNFDGPESGEVRRFLCDNALMWLRDYHFDGLRLDATHAIIDTSALHFLEQLAQEVRALETDLTRPLVLIAESDRNDPRPVHSTAAGGYGLDACWSDDFHHALHSLLTGERDGYYADFGTLADLAKALRDGVVYDGRYSRFRRRRHGRPMTSLSPDQLVVCAQNHDQIGNRACGERLGALVGEAESQIAAALLLTSPFVPLLFQGEEWGASTPFLYFTDHQEPDLGRAVREGRRSEFAAFGWDPERIPDPQAEETFRRSQLDWDERARPRHSGLLNWYRQLIRLRRRMAPASGDARAPVQVRCDEAQRWLLLERGRLVVACNLSDEAVQLPIAPGAQLSLASDPSTTIRGGRIDLAPRSVAVAVSEAEALASDSAPLHPIS